MMNARMLPIFIKMHFQIIKQGRCVQQTVPFQVKNTDMPASTAFHIASAKQWFYESTQD